MRAGYNVRNVYVKMMKSNKLFLLLRNHPRPRFLPAGEIQVKRTQEMAVGDFPYTQQFIQEIKDKITSEVSTSPDEYDTKLYDRWLSDEELFLRYVKRKRGDTSATITFLLEVLRWRLKHGISHLNDQSFPKEFYDFGGIHVHGFDRDGNAICHVRIRFFYKQPEILELLKKFAVYQMLKADELGASHGKGWILLFDCTGAGVANADIEMVNFVNSTLRNYFPHGQVYVLSHNIPWLLTALKTLVYTMLPANVKNRMKFSNDKSISEYIDLSSLPAYMGGTSNIPYPSPVPRGVLTTAEMVKKRDMPLSPEQELRVQKYYEKVYKEFDSLQNSK